MPLVPAFRRSKTGEAPIKAGTDAVLQGLARAVEVRLRSQRLVRVQPRRAGGPGLASFQKQGTEFDIAVEHPDRRIAVPKAQPLDLVLTFEMWHAQFEHCGFASSQRNRCHPSATDFRAIKRRVGNKGPPTLQIPQHVRQAAEPIATFRRRALSREACGDW